MLSSSANTDPGRQGGRARAERIARSIALLLAIVAVAGVTTAWLINRQADEQRDHVASRVPAALQEPATQVAPLTSRPLTSTPTTANPATVPSTRTRRPAAKPAPKPIVAPLLPQHLYVPAIKVNTTVAPKPTEMSHDPFLGKDVPSFGVPDDLYTTTWWSSGPKPGGVGMAVILGHTQVGGGYGVFNDLAKLKPGDVVGVQHGTTVLRFAVMAVHTGISKTDPNALASVLNNHPAAARLALLTCSGDFNQGYRESAENTVVFTRLVSVSR